MRRSLYLLAAMLLGGSFPAAHAQTVVPPTCAKIDDVIERAAKRAALAEESGLADSSAPRELVRKQEATNALLLMQANLLVASSLRCPPRSRPIDPGDYRALAQLCAQARITGNRARVASACDVDSWPRAGELRVKSQLP
jgi:hypothetical protein